MPIEQYEHTGKERLNNPSVGLVKPENDPEEPSRKACQDEPHLGPRRVRGGKTEHASFEVPTVSLRVNERSDSLTAAQRQDGDAGRSAQPSAVEGKEKPRLLGGLHSRIHEHLLKLGFSKNCDGYFIEGGLSKQRIRDVHSAHRRDVLQQNQEFIAAHSANLIDFFASGDQVDPERIDPELIEVRTESAESRLFRLATLLWSVPVSRGFGRRLRFLVRDRQNGCLIGLFALGDPVFNLSARDTWIGWSHDDRRKRLVHAMDAYVVGALPPYSLLIGGKLIAALIGSSEVRASYERKYVGRKAVISGLENRAKLVLLTTSSALGRSSIYNRLNIPSGPGFVRVGATKGFGHFHISGEIFEALRSRLEEIGHPYASGHRFGMGPNWRIRVARAALESLGIRANAILKHGIEREVYAIPLANNWRQVLLGKHQRAQFCTKPLSEIARFCLDRWILPRAERDPRYKSFSRGRVLECLQNGGPGPSW